MGWSVRLLLPPTKRRSPEAAPPESELALLAFSVMVPEVAAAAFWMSSAVPELSSIAPTLRFEPLSR